MPSRASVHPQGADSDPFVKHAATLRKLYEDDGLTASQAQAAIAAHEGFPEMSLKAFQRGLSQLRLKKNLKRGDWANIGRHLSVRGSSQQSGVYVHGILVPWSKVWKEVRRSGFKIDEQPPERLPKLPPGVRISTPSHPQRPDLYISKLNIRYPDLDEAAPAMRPTEQDGTSELIPLESDWTSFVTGVPASMPGDHAERHSAFPGACMAYHAVDPTLFGVMEIQLAPSERNFGFYIENYKIPWRQVEDCLSTLLLGYEVPLDPRLEDTASAVAGGAELVSRPALPLKGSKKQCFVALSWPSIFEDCMSYLAARARSGRITIPRPLDDLGFQARALYQLSNNLIILGSQQDHRDLLDIMEERFPQQTVEHMLKVGSGYPSIRAFWESLVRIVIQAQHKAGFSWLMRLSLSKPECRSWATSNIVGNFDTACLLGCKDVQIALSSGEHRNQFVEAWMETDKHPTQLDPIAIQLYNQGVLGIRNEDDLAELQNKFIDYLCALQMVPSSHGPEHTLRCDFITMIIRHGALSDQDTMRGPFLDRLYCFDRALYDFTVDLVPLRPGEATLSGAIAASRVGPQAIAEYFDTRDLDDEDCLQSFFRRLLKHSLTTAEISPLLVVAALVKGANPNVYLTFFCEESHVDKLRRGKELCQYPCWRPVDASLLRCLLFTAAEEGVSEDSFTNHQQIIDVLISYGAIVDTAVLAAPLRNNGDSRKAQVLLQSLIGSCGSDICHLGGRALFAAAILNDYESVLLLHSVGVSFTAYMDPKGIVESQRRKGFRTPLEVAIHGDPRYGGAVSLDMMRFCLDLACNTSGELSMETLQRAYGAIICSRFSADRMKRCRLLEEYGFDTVACPPQRRDVHRLFDNVIVERNQQAIEFFEFLFERGVPVDDVVLTGLIDRDASMELVRRALAARTDADCLGDHTTRKLVENWADGPLRASIRAGNMQLLELFVRRHADACRGPAERAMTLGQVLQGACEQRPGETKIKMVKLLLAEGADINAPAKDPILGITSLQAAARCGDLSLALLLLEHGAILNAVTVVHWGSREKSGLSSITALDFAALDGHLDMVQFLLNAGAVSGEHGDNCFERAIRWAEDSGHGAVADVIRGHSEFISSLGPRMAF